MLSKQQQMAYQLKASQFLEKRLNDQVADAVLNNTEGGLLRMNGKSILLIATYSGVEPWDLIKEHGFGIMNQWYIDELEQITHAFNGATISTVHLSIA